ncbi:MULTISPECIES: hypothetical protein [Arthrobacter]|uniref:Lipoprotein n=1 Tax=Arthrobacter psychrochitiniphilus TaxID=291045 RepID=A0A2V3E1H5_9MICC|nr:MULTISPECIES: hypothetical protein [Arthrobacter]NYG16832.1 hypothetical protein [Arthrobacter psychrochitiniphilus]PXA69084.1 hypothetical protein CVS29_00410 [Arthrobacter psychrochitiniphilus]
MAKQMSSMYKRSITTLGLGAALMMGMTGCMGGTKDVPTPIPMQKSATAQSTESAADGSDSDRGSSEVEPSATKEASAPAAANGKLTPAGTNLKIGDVAKTHSNSGEQGTDKYKEATFDTTVTKIVAGDPADLAKLEDSAKFAGQTPYYVFYESTLTSLSKPTAGMSDAYLDGHLKDGSKAQKLIVFGTLGNCKSGSFKTEGDGDAFSYVVGSTKTSCSVFLAPGGDAVTAASYSDSSFNYENYSDNPYRDKPVIWGK